MKATIAILTIWLALPCWASGQQKNGAVDLMPKAIIKADSGWKSSGKALTVEATWPIREVLCFDFDAMPDEYDLYATVERMDTETKDFAVGLVVGGATCCYHFDAWEATASCIALIGGQEGEHANGQVFKKGKPRSMKLAIRKSGLTVELDGKKFWSGKVPWSKTSTGLPIPEKGKPFLLAAGGAWKVSAFAIAPALR